MTTIPRKLRFEVLVGCTFVETLPEHIRRGAVFRALKKNGDPYRAAARMIPHMQDDAIYVASGDGTADGVPFLAVPEAVDCVMPVIDLGD